MKVFVQWLSVLQPRQPDFSKVYRSSLQSGSCHYTNQHTRNCDTQVHISEQSDQVPGTTLVPFFLQALSTHFGGSIMHHATLQASESIAR